MQSFSTEQEQFWAGDFGDAYIDRNQGLTSIASNLSLFGRILSRTQNIQSAIEFGANIGLNMIALRQLVPTIELAAVEINLKAVELLSRLPDVQVYATSILDFVPGRQWDFVFTKTVLIHIKPDLLPNVYDLLYGSSRKYIGVLEYYNPSPMEVVYRGHQGKLFKRDFAGELLDRHKDLSLVDYGFVYHRDNSFRQDDLTWFLLEKKS